MAQMPVVCTTCRDPVNDQFDPVSGARDTLTLNSHVEFEEQCVVFDTIVFYDGGGIIFAPRIVDREREVYFDNYNVVCRKLVVIGGKEPPSNPCRPGDPGDVYRDANLITWKGRLKPAADGVPFATGAPDGGFAPGESPFDTDVWIDQGQGNQGQKGQRGHDGLPGPNGAAGRHILGFSEGQVKERPPTLSIVALEVEFDGVGSKLVVDWDGQAGGNGARGQNGGNGGSGMGGRDGSTDESVWGDSCERPPGNGGDAGDGGHGGKGGDGGQGGWGGRIVVISRPAHVAPGGALFSSQVSYVNGGAIGGNPGDGGRGGKASLKVGRPGKKTSECEAAHDGQPGQDGVPDTVGGTGAQLGAPGTNGMPGPLGFEAIDPPGTGTCADLMPDGSEAGPLSVASIAPGNGARGATVPVAIIGTGFTAAAQVQVSGAAVTAGPLTITPTQINCSLTIGAAAPQTVRDVTVRLSALQQVTLSGAFTVI